MKIYTWFPYFFQTLTRPLVYWLLKFFCRLEVEGLENIEAIDGNFILASNHQHELDGFFLPATIPLSVYFPPIFPVSREKEFYKDKGLRGKILYGGLFFKFMGAYPAYSGLKDYEKSLENQLDIIGDGHSILIFPEETVKSTTAKGGVGFLANAIDKSVVPVKIEGINNMTILDFFLRRKKMKVQIRNPIRQTDINDNANIEPNPTIWKKTAKNVMNNVHE